MLKPMINTATELEIQLSGQDKLPCQCMNMTLRSNGTWAITVDRSKISLEDQATFFLFT